MKLKKRLAGLLILFFALTTSSEGINQSYPYLPTSTQATEERLLIPGGTSIGVTLSTDGVLVVNVSDIVASDGKHLSPARESGIKSGDIIKEYNDTKILTVEDLTNAINLSNGKSSPIKIVRSGNYINTLIKPQTSKTDGMFKIGAWVKDAASGIGTLTYIDPKTGEFAALGHGICDSDTGKLFSIVNGNIMSASIVSIDKGEKGIPGELNGIFDESGPILGKISSNRQNGIFGKSDKIIQSSNLNDMLPIAGRQDVQIGPAYIISSIEGKKAEKFEVEIQKVMPKAIHSQKGMIIQVTDKRLIEKTGGIVRGMSGSPIIQNGKLIGAVTHVFVNDPTRGYGIFIENMLAEAEKIK